MNLLHCNVEAHNVRHSVIRNPVITKPNPIAGPRLYKDMKHTFQIQITSLKTRTPATVASKQTVVH